VSKLKVGLVFGGKSAEHEISLMSARSVMANADRKKYKIIPIAISREGYWLTAGESETIINSDCSQVSIDKGKYNNIGESLKNFLDLDIDLLFPLIHGPFGEDGRIQGFFEMLNIPYVGAGVIGSALGMDKVKMKEIFSVYELPQVDYQVLNYNQFKSNNNFNIRLDFPCFVKPANMGSSIGITKIKDSKQLINALKEAFSYDNKVIIEEGLDCREIECSVLGNYELKASLPGEIKPAHEYYDYEAKYIDETTNLIIPAQLDEEKIKEVQQLAIKSFKVLDCKGFARIDFFMRNRDKKIMVNEINTIPGFTKYSMYPKLWQESGIKYSELIDKLIALAQEV